jgi:hypothetical protein
MALDTEDIKLITDLQGKMEERLVTAIGGLGSGLRATMKSEVDRIEVLDDIRNGKIECNDEEIKKLKKETKIARWIQRNRKLSVIILFIAMFTAAWGYHTINFKRTVERILKIELKENP